MRRFLASLLITFMVVTPALACCCSDLLPKAATAHLEHQDHHTTAAFDHHANSHNQSGHDCSKADFQKTYSIADIQSKNLKIKTVIDPIAAFDHSDVLPPWIDVDESRPIAFNNDPPDLSLPVYLTTQRLRI